MMELYERIAVVRKAKGLTQEQMGELVGVSRQAVSKWESGQTVPDALTVAKLCQVLDMSADYVLLGKEPEEQETTSGPLPHKLPDVCPCCGKPVSGTLCPACGCPLSYYPPHGSRYALVAGYAPYGERGKQAAQMVKQCGFTQEEATAAAEILQRYGGRIILRRDLPDHAAHWLARHLDRESFELRIVEDRGEADEVLVNASAAMELPAPEKHSNGLGFWGVVGAVVVALLILSFF